ncbi:hypothetical protein CPT_Summit_060 [Stenotrophomonas phage Summit]|nr:hypothetical protein CPT_Summit_060 [Stenotrophomonas phage Summit]
MGVKMGKSGDSAAPQQKSYEQHLFSGEASGQVTVTKKKGSDPEKTVVAGMSTSESPGQVIPTHELVQLEIQGGKTINLGNYESAKINVSLRVPCTMQTLPDMYKFATGWVNEKIEEMIKGETP